MLNLIKYLDFYYVLLILIANMHGLFLSKIKKALQLLMFFQIFLDESNCKTNKKWINKGKEFYSRSKKSFLQNSDIEL